MDTTLDQFDAPSAANHVAKSRRVARLPFELRVLYITTFRRSGGWLADALSADRASRVTLEEAIGATEGMRRLRDELFDAVLISHAPGELDALALLDGVCAANDDQPLLILGNEPIEQMSPLCYEAGADEYLHIPTATTRHLIWAVARAVQRATLACENRRLLSLEAQRLEQGYNEAQRLLAEQKQVLQSADQKHCAGQLLPDALLEHYRELLRAYVVMGSGNLHNELVALTQVLIGGGVAPRQALDMHLGVLDEEVQSLGSRSARHVMARADLLALELMILLADPQTTQETPDG
jgi:DNA-binding response OmpR family regulator